MIKKLLLITMLLVFTMSTKSYAIDINSYKNGSFSDKANEKKIASYINSKHVELITNVYCIGTDSVKYYESFIDQERDYYNLVFSQHFLSNSQLTEQQRQVDLNNLYFMYVHNPSIYDNPVTASVLL